jgi:hypothetical protein
MSKVTQIEAELKRPCPAELRRIRDWLDNFLEDKLAFTTEFESSVRESEREMSAGLKPRVRKR